MQIGVTDYDGQVVGVVDLDKASTMRQHIDLSDSSTGEVEVFHLQWGRTTIGWAKTVRLRPNQSPRRLPNFKALKPGQPW